MAKGCVINFDHVLRTIQNLVLDNVQYKATALYFGSSSYFSRSEGSDTYFINIGFETDMSYYVTVWNDSNRAILSLSTDNDLFEDDIDDNKHCSFKLFDSEEEHFMSSTVSNNTYVPYEVIREVVQLGKKLNKLYEGIEK